MKALAHIDLRPPPMMTRQFSAFVHHLNEVVEQVGTEQAVQSLVERLLAASPADPPSERRRLHLLYKQVHTLPELQGLAANSLWAAGLLPERTDQPTEGDEEPLSADRIVSMYRATERLRNLYKAYCASAVAGQIILERGAAHTMKHRDVPPGFMQEAAHRLTAQSETDVIFRLRSRDLERRLHQLRAMGESK